MNIMLKTELKRAFANRMFLTAVLLGSALAILQMAQEALPYAFGFNLYADQYPPSVYNTCMGLGFSVWQYVFYMVFPILAALPYADSYLRDVKSGYVKNLYLKVEKWKYLTAKLIAVFLSGGLAVFIPVALNFFLVALCVPAVTPHAATGFFMVFSQATGAALFYTQPHLFLLLFAALLFLSAGILACTALAFSFFIKYGYVLLITPFLLFLAISYGSTLLPAGSPINISQWIIPSQAYGPLNLPVAAAELGLMLLISAILYFYRGTRDEIF